MRLHRAFSLGGLLAALLLSPTAAALDTSGPGFKILGTRPVPTFGSAYATLRNGSVFQFDGLVFQLYSRDGSLLADLGSLNSFVFPSFAAIDPSGSFAIVGESSNGDLFRVDLGGGGVSSVANVFFNYDAEFDVVDPDYLWVSAATGGFGTGNDIVRVHIPSGGVSFVADIPVGSSGPLEVDALGDLYYADVPPDFCPAPGQVEVVRWSRAQLLSGVVQTIADATVMAAGLDVATSMERDPVSGIFFLAENDFCAPFARVVEVDFDAGVRGAVLIESFNTISNLEIFAGNKGATLQAYQPENVRLKCSSTDFNNSTSDMVTVVPQRPRTRLDLPASYPGIVTLTVEDAVPNAGVLLLWTPVAFQLAKEQASNLGFGFPVFFAAPLNKLRRFPFPLTTDGNGTAVYSYFDDGSLAGRFLLQGLALGTQGQAVGTTTPVLN
jgi:hypothetical protein